MEELSESGVSARQGCLRSHQLLLQAQPKAEVSTVLPAGANAKRAELELVPSEIVRVIKVPLWFFSPPPAALPLIGAHRFHPLMKVFTKEIV